MIKQSVILFLRGLVLFLILLPIWKPYLTESSERQNQDSVTVLYPAQRLLTSIEKRVLSEKLSRQGLPNQKLNWTPYGQGSTAQGDLMLQADEVVRLVRASPGLMVAVVDDNLWGPAARRFNNAIKQTQAFVENRLFVVSSAEIFSSINGTDAIRSQPYLALSEVFLPTLQFNGDASLINIDVVGDVSGAQVSGDIEANVIVRTAESVLATQKVLLTPNDKGVVNQTLTVPVTLIKTGTQALRVQLLSDFAFEPLNQAFTVVNAVHAKTSILHVAVGPDWSLRNLRQRLKFWPNLDLISYYILRELGDDFSIPESQLTLIQFPTHKLFDEQLPNFHGIVAQNFPLDIYLQNREPDNLVNYVTNGGRLVLFGGPLTFESQDPRILSLIPCENKPDWDSENVYKWEAGLQWMGEGRFRERLENMSSHFTAINCIPKKNALVVAQTQGETKHPTVVAMNVGKGLVLLFLSGDWHTSFAQAFDDQALDNTNRNEAAAATKEVFQWMTEFLQRRQDSGLRPPEIVSPRIYEGDKTLLVRARGLLRGDERLGIYQGSQKLTSADVKHLEGLDLDILQLATPLGQNLPTLSEAENVSLHLNFDEVEQDYTPRATEWKLFAGSRAEREKLANPILLDGLHTFKNESAADNKNVTPQKNLSHQPISLVYPWLLGATLLVLAIEQFLSHILWRSRFLPKGES